LFLKKIVFFVCLLLMVIRSIPHPCFAMDDDELENTETSTRPPVVPSSSSSSGTKTVNPEELEALLDITNITLVSEDPDFSLKKHLDKLLVKAQKSDNKTRFFTKDDIFITALIPYYKYRNSSKKTQDDPGLFLIALDEAFFTRPISKIKIALKTITALWFGAAVCAWGPLGSNLTGYITGTSGINDTNDNLIPVDSPLSHSLIYSFMILALPPFANQGWEWVDHAWNFFAKNKFTPTALDKMPHIQPDLHPWQSRAISAYIALRKAMGPVLLFLRAEELFPQWGYGFVGSLASVELERGYREARYFFRCSSQREMNAQEPLVSQYRSVLIQSVEKIQALINSKKSDELVEGMYEFIQNGIKKLEAAKVQKALFQKYLYQTLMSNGINTNEVLEGACKNYIKIELGNTVLDKVLEIKIQENIKNFINSYMTSTQKSDPIHDIYEYVCEEIGKIKLQQGLLDKAKLIRQLKDHLKNYFSPKQKKELLDFIHKHIGNNNIKDQNKLKKDIKRLINDFIAEGLAERIYQCVQEKSREEKKKSAVISQKSILLGIKKIFQQDVDDIISNNSIGSVPRSNQLIMDDLRVYMSLCLESDSRKGTVLDSLIDKIMGEAREDIKDSELVQPLCNKIYDRIQQELGKVPLGDGLRISEDDIAISLLSIFFLKQQEQLDYKHLKKGLTESFAKVERAANKKAKERLENTAKKQAKQETGSTVALNMIEDETQRETTPLLDLTAMEKEVKKVNQVPIEEMSRLIFLLRKLYPNSQPAVFLKELSEDFLGKAFVGRVLTAYWSASKLLKTFSSVRETIVKPVSIAWAGLDALTRPLLERYQQQEAFQDLSRFAIRTHAFLPLRRITDVFSTYCASYLTVATIAMIFELLPHTDPWITILIAVVATSPSDFASVMHWAQQRWSNIISGASNLFGTCGHMTVAQQRSWLNDYLNEIKDLIPQFDNKTIKQWFYLTQGAE